MQAPARRAAAHGGMISIFEDEQASRCVPVSAFGQNHELSVSHAIAAEPSRTAASSCAACGAVFSDFMEQRAHFKSDWHRYCWAFVADALLAC